MSLKHPAKLFSLNSCSIVILIFLSILLASISLLIWFRTPLHGKYARAPEYVLFMKSSSIIPENATEIECEGRRGLPFYFAWKCKSSESDFLALSNKNQWSLSDNTEKIRFLAVLYNLDTKPDSAWFYDGGKNNGGGTRILYDRTKNILYGFTSSY